MSKKCKDIFADKIRMIAKSIYDAADDIAGNTDGCTEISINFTIESENSSADLPEYEIVRRHYPKAKTAALFPTHATLSHDEGLCILGKCCATCKYENDIDIPYCNTCSRNPDLVVDYRLCSDNWEDLE